MVGLFSLVIPIPLDYRPVWRVNFYIIRDRNNTLNEVGLMIKVPSRVTGLEIREVWMGLLQCFFYIRAFYNAGS